MKSSVIILTIFFSISIIWSDTITFEKTIGGELEDYAVFVQEIPEGGYILFGIIGSSSTRQNQSLSCMQTDAHGEIITSEYLFIKGDYLQPTRDGGYIAILTYMKSNSWTIRLTKINKDYVAVWENEIDGSWGYSACETADKGYIIIVSQRVNGEGEVFLQKLDETCKLQWEKAFNGIFGLGHYYVTQTSDLGYVVIGDRFQDRDDHKSPVLHLIKFDQNGNEIWYREFPKGISAMCVQQTKDGGYIITGSKDSPTITGMLSLFVMKTDAKGNVEWSKEFKSESHQEGIFVQQTSDGGFIITGRTGPAANKDIILIKTNSSGDVIK